MHMTFLDSDNTSEFDRAISIAADVDCQWDLYLANTYKLQELQKLDFAAVRLPPEWFQDWLMKLTSQNQ